MSHSGTRYFIGLISGTSADGIDAALVSFNNEADITPSCEILSYLTAPYPPEIREEVLALATPCSNEIDRLGVLDVQLGKLFAQAALAAAEMADIDIRHVSAIGSHGQTVRHRPQTDEPFTLQLADPNQIAAITRCVTVADFRRRDMACGGQGAPLAPGFHQFAFSHPEHTTCIANIGGIANITMLKPDSPCIGYDTGPGNGLMDAWIKRHKGLDFDENGQWSASGSVNQALVAHWLAHPYFHLPAPKSTGREEFQLQWLDQSLLEFAGQLSPEDVQASLCELTATSIAKEVNTHNPKKLYVCGGGAHNNELLTRLQGQLHETEVTTTDSLGIHPDWVEAACFAWLAKQRVDSLSGNLPSVTGASEFAVLGAIYA